MMLFFVKQRGHLDRQLWSYRLVIKRYALRAKLSFNLEILSYNPFLSMGASSEWNQAVTVQIFKFK
jgi:hypothetical protein